MTETLINPAIIREAATWLMKLHSDDATEADQQAWQHWRSRSPEHQRAWQCAQRLTDAFSDIPPELGMPVLDRPVACPQRRRAALKALALLLTTAPVAWLAAKLPWEDWSADYQTATGERSTIALADGTQLVLNTASSVDVRFDSRQRLVQLYTGEVLVTTAADKMLPARPFRVQTRQGMLRALGTRFDVRQEGMRSHVAVFEGAVELTPLKAPGVVVQAGQQCSFTANRAGPVQAADDSQALWSQGVLFADKMRLADFVDELSRYRHGRLSCDPAVADQRVSGAFQLKDTDQALLLLSKVLPVRIERITQYWVTVRAA
ncbi:FecR domain-containing protein [Collimonas sp. OK412]|jgi:transmembrane sensor|uniref:FecR domain-containing protein n=1 Tax=Collimonas sp. (strain OK412) TaxID=1801619 RepID=UPI0008E70754|nr:FecR domain-containing protein [Collimonas sp. OK412]SFB87038.1 FecR family protein [Collimonas sp. OK412]